MEGDKRHFYTMHFILFRELKEFYTFDFVNLYFLNPLLHNKVHMKSVFRLILRF